MNRCKSKGCHQITRSRCLANAAADTKLSQLAVKQPQVKSMFRFQGTLACVPLKVKELLLTVDAQHQNASVLQYDSVRMHTSYVMRHLPVFYRVCPLWQIFSTK